MFKNFMHARYVKGLLHCVAAYLAIISVHVWAGETEAFVDKLKTHYEKTRSITAFSLNYHFFNKQFRSHDYWDYQVPNRVMSVRMVEVDLDKKHFYDNDILYGPGGEVLDRVQFQNDTHSYFYEKNGNYLGKRYFNEGLGNFDRFMHYHAFNIDFIVVRPLLDESNVADNITLHQDKAAGTTILTHKNALDHIVDYEFSNNSLQLVTVNNKTRQAFYVYDDYQTTRGITFARQVKKYYNGEKVPAYISFNDKLEIIEEVDASKLQLPPGYGPEVQAGDGILVAKEIATGLYLVADSAAWRNSVFKVNGDEITVFGAAGYPELATKTINLIREQFPEKKISAIHVTHAQEADIAGLGVFAKQGIEILADEYSIAAIKAYPDFANDIEGFKFRAIKDEQLIDGARFYILESLHSKRQSFVHFEYEGIIFQADFLHIAYDNTIPKVIPNYTRAFIDFVRSKQLKVNRIVGNYQNNNISVEVMNKAYNSLM
ncbi:hypothetical protein [Pseudoalteromonas sp. OOF1S-7]|uniref:hypothetical protein n=1 Tax=Pseudoalteromonas sp. OOF1S-7 TaxID=2917757 RepID=UPI001EF5C3BE|nr:hypothetical protein [Pseudoalteromonas sp. OOF1S-7]MCG7537512.1 hypothetical protein [Pseudoalteromonas sp. OOF1S-7]